MPDSEDPDLYRQGRDGVAWHSDDESDLGLNPSIGSVSFGETRRFQFKHKQNKELRHEIDLTHAITKILRTRGGKKEVVG